MSMAETAPAPVNTPVKSTPKSSKTKVTKAKKAKAPSHHPKYLEMAVSSINSLKERNGSSRQAILKYIMGHYSVGKDPKVVNTHLKLALKRGVASGSLKHAKGQGASGSFRVSVDKKTSNTKKPAVAKVKSSTTAEKKVKKVAKVEKPKKPKAKHEKKKVSSSASSTSKPKKLKEKKPKTPKKKSAVEKTKKKTPKPKKPKAVKKLPEKKVAAKPKKERKAKSPKKSKK